MTKEIVKYQNRFNDINFSQKFNTTQANIFFAVISRLRNKGNDKVSFSYKHLAKLSGIHYGRRVGLFHHEIQQTYDKIQHLSIYQNNKDVYRSINLFSSFTNDKKHKICTIKINPDFVGFLNHLAKQFTRFSLNQYTILRSKYAKALFRYIKMFRLSGNVYLPMKKFRRILGVPKSYTGDMITRRIINPAKVQLTPLVRNLHIITLRKGYGTTITGYHITFKPENPKYDKLIGFNRTNVGTKKWMQTNVKYNQWLTPKQRQKALNNLKSPASKRKKHKHEPMKAFNSMLESATIDDLRYYLILHNRRSPTVNFSEYQVRKLKKTIIKKHNKIIDERRLQRQSALKEEKQRLKMFNEKNKK